MKIEIEFNGSIIKVEKGSSLAEFANEKELSSIGTAIAIDDIVIPKNEWSIYFFSGFVSVTVFQAIAGG